MKYSGFWKYCKFIVSVCKCLPHPTGRIVFIYEFCSQFSSWIILKKWNHKIQFAQKSFALRIWFLAHSRWFLCHTKEFACYGIIFTIITFSIHSNGLVWIDVIKRKCTQLVQILDVSWYRPAQYGWSFVWLQLWVGQLFTKSRA